MIQFVRPSRGHVTQRYANIQPDGNPHAGQDYAYSNGHETFPEVYAAADGLVLFAGDARGLTWPNIMYVNIDFDRSDNQDSSAGNYTIIQHFENGVPVALTGYGHQEEVWVKAGQWVKASQRIGTVGETGFSFGKHLHFDLVLAPFDVNDSPFYGRVDPNPYINGLSYAGSITQSGSTTPKEWYEMALSEEAKNDLRELLREGDTGRVQGYFNWVETPLPGWNGSVSAAARVAGTDQAVNDIRAQLGATNGIISGLVGALAAVTKGEAFDEAKLLAGVEAAAERGASRGAAETLAAGIELTAKVKEG